MNTQLAPSDFGQFFAALWRYEAFPWQKRLAAHLCETGVAPAVLDLPTGTGKTAVIDVALFHLACELAAGGPRKAPLRIAWAVDRRLIVDDAFDRASKIAEKLENADHGILKVAADLFRGIAGEGSPPLVVRRLRGGIPREGDWARTPLQPTVISSTIDQIGSRLLFRGYGVSDTMRPIHAGLLGEDALFVLDEVHLSEAFRQTLESVAAYDRPTGMPWQFMQLSATPQPTQNGEPPFQLSAEDLEHSELHRRLSAAKPATLVNLGRVRFGSAEHAARFASEALHRIALDGNQGAKSVLVAVNRVELARQVHEKILEHLKQNGHEEMIDVTRLVGRGRDIEKDVIRGEVVDRCKSDPTSIELPRSGKPYIVVATQCVEAGADLDFDALVTQIAPLDALRQRCGRLNRMGRPIVATAAILATDSEVSASAKPDPVYDGKPELTSAAETRNGKAVLRETWSWLQRRAQADGTVDFGTGKMMTIPSQERAALRGRISDAPILMPEHVNALSRTYPAPNWSPTPSLYLHGAPNSLADVNVVWRADIPSPKVGTSDDHVDEVKQILSLVPPRQGEVVPMPISSVRRWLRGVPAGDVTDIEIDVGDEGPKQGPPSRKAWRWRGADDDVEAVSDRGVRPGDTIVVPSSDGGCDLFGWNPRSGYVDDVGARAAQPYATRTYAVRLHRNLLEQELRREDENDDDETFRNRVSRSWATIAAAITDEANQKAPSLIKALLSNDGVPDSWRVALTNLQRAKGRISVEKAYSTAEQEDNGARGVILFAKHGLKAASNAENIPESATENDSAGSQGCCENGQSLVDHSEQVRDIARRFAAGLLLSKSLADDIALAAFLHDVGKADPRFQRYLTGAFSHSGYILAKSGKRRGFREDAAARRGAKLPERWRHEALSVRIARVHPDFAASQDPELVLWLIGTHHGYGRPQFPHEEPLDEESRGFHGFTPYETERIEVEPSPGPQCVDFMLPISTTNGTTHVDWQTMFLRLEHRYGVWGLAYLEAIVRLADHRASEAAVPSKKADLA